MKAVEYVSDASSFITYNVKPQLKTLGPRYGKLLPKINAYLAQSGVGDQVVAAHKAGNPYTFQLEGASVSLAPEDVLVSTGQKEGFVAESDRDTSVVLDIRLTPALIEEGFVRELVSKIQTMRKEAGFEVMDKIKVYAHGNDKIQEVMKAHEDEIKSEVLADEMVLGETDGYVKEWNINKETVTMGVKKLS